MPQRRARRVVGEPVGEALPRLLEPAERAAGARPRGRPRGPSRATRPWPCAAGRARYPCVRLPASSRASCSSAAGRVARARAASSNRGRALGRVVARHEREAERSTRPPGPASPAPRREGAGRRRLRTRFSATASRPAALFEREARGEAAQAVLVRRVGDEQLAVQLLAAAQLDEVVVRALRRRRAPPRRLRSDHRPRERGTLSYTPSVWRTSTRAAAVGDLDGVSLGRGQSRERPAEGRRRLERKPFVVRAASCRPGPARRRPGGSRSRSARRAARPTAPAADVQHRVRRHAREAADLAHRQPVLVEADRLLRLRGTRRSPGCGRGRPGSRPRRCRCRRAPSASRGRPRRRPRSRPSSPAAPRGRRSGRRPPACAGGRSPMKRLAAAVAKSETGPIVWLPDRARGRRPSRVHRPGVHLREAVGRGEVDRVEDARVVPHLDRRVRPPVEPVAEVAAVVESRVLLENGAARAQRQLDAPLHAVDEVDVADPRRTRCRPRAERSRSRRARTSPSCARPGSCTRSRTSPTTRGTRPARTSATGSRRRGSRRSPCRRSATGGRRGRAAPRRAGARSRGRGGATSRGLRREVRFSRIV